MCFVVQKLALHHRIIFGKTYSYTYRWSVILEIDATLSREQFLHYTKFFITSQLFRKLIRVALQPPPSIPVVLAVKYTTRHAITNLYAKCHWVAKNVCKFLGKTSGKHSTIFFKAIKWFLQRKWKKASTQQNCAGKLTLPQHTNTRMKLLLNMLRICFFRAALPSNKKWPHRRQSI